MSVTLPAFTKTATFDVGVSETVDRLNQAQGNTKDMVEGVKAMEIVRTVVGASTVTGGQNDYAFDALKTGTDAGVSIVTWNGASASSLTGLAGGLSGRRLTIRNITSAQVLTLTNESGSSTSANRITCATGADILVGPGMEVSLWYDATSTRWRASLFGPSAGTFTPAITFGGAAVGVTYGTQLGFYSRVGDRVFFNLRIVLTSKGSSTGALAITGLPVTSNASGTNCSVSSVVNAMSATIVAPLQGSIGAAATSIAFTYLAAGTATSVTDTECTNTTVLNVTGMYQA